MRPLLAAVAVLALAGPAAQADETETVTRTVALNSGGTLDLKTFSGRVIITPTDTNEVTVNAVRHGLRRQLDRVRLDVTTSGSTVYVDANRHDHSWWGDNVVDTELDIRVPRRTNLHITSFSAPVEVDGVDAADVQAHTFSGTVDLRFDRWQPHQRIDIKTFSGRVTLRVPEHAGAHVDFNSFSGRLDSDVPLVLHSTSRRSVSAELGAGAADGSLRVHTFSGSVKIQR
ncbi:MAG TPA: DUF4097 family beta strand repeat-containing protein [Vicinamibacterales bacterium]|nr:DUF4097 family beta strand repeat-containing protein [Vicinamibacterales bacterium]